MLLLRLEMIMLECQVKLGTVRQVTNQERKQELTVEVDGVEEAAINYPNLTAVCEPDDQVVLNTTGVALGLGTGGYHFVMAVVGKTREVMGAGHIMKLRYTPCQGKVLSVEEEGSPYHGLMQEARTLEALPVLVGSLHSMLAPAALVLQHLRKGLKIVYIMSDGAALPIALSHTVQALQNMGVIAETITFGHAFGGDFEAVTVFSALLCAKHVCQADVAIVLMGPGVVGTNTPWGTTALEQAVYLDAVSRLGGTPVAILRMSSADQRQRHLGISHHTVTALSSVVTSSCHIGVPFGADFHKGVSYQLHLLRRHTLHWVDCQPLLHLLSDQPFDLRSMGRTPQDDPLFFAGVLASGMVAAECLGARTTVQE